MSHHGRTVGSIPSGLFILTAEEPPLRYSMLVSWVQQAGIDPLMLTVAVRSDRPVLGVLERRGRFVLNQISVQHSELIRRFARSGGAEGESFEGVALLEQPPGWDAPRLADAMSSLLVERHSSLAGCDHTILLCRVLAERIHDPHATPFIHVRKSGLHY